MFRQITFEVASGPSTIEQLAPWGSAGLALIGVIVGRFWEGRSGRRSRREDRLAGVCAELVRATHTFHRRVSEAWFLASQGTPSRPSQPSIEAAGAVADDCWRLHSMLEILGPAELAEAAQALCEKQDAAMAVIADPPKLAIAQAAAPLGFSQSKEAEAMAPSLDEFLRAARSALR